MPQGPGESHGSPWGLRPLGLSFAPPRDGKKFEELTKSTNLSSSGPTGTMGSPAPRARLPRFDHVDLAILRRLARDGRATYKEMAQETGVATSTVMTRVRRLSASGVIERFTLVVNPELVNRPLTAFLGIRVQPDRKEAVVERLREMGPVLEVYEMLEPYDLIAKVRTESIPALKESVLRTLTGLDGVLDATTFLTTRRHKEVSCYLD